MRRYKNVPATILPGCCFLHSDTEPGANLKKQGHLSNWAFFKRSCCTRDCPDYTVKRATAAALPLGLTVSWPWWSKGAAGAQFLTSSRERCRRKLYSCPGRESFRVGSCLSQRLTALWGTHCSAFVVFASCLWRSSRNDVDWSNTIWWSSPPIRLGIAVSRSFYPLWSQNE